jgi:hypothetical protein
MISLRGRTAPTRFCDSDLEIYAAPIACNTIPDFYEKLHTAFNIDYLPPLPLVSDPVLARAARKPIYAENAVPNMMELALLGDTVLKTIIMEKLQGLSRCGKPGQIAVSRSTPA